MQQEPNNISKMTYAELLELQQKDPQHFKAIIDHLTKK